MQDGRGSAMTDLKKTKDKESKNSFEIEVARNPPKKIWAT